LDGLCRACRGDRALIAVDAAIMADLQEQGPVAELVTSESTLRAARAGLLVDGNLVVGVLDRAATNRVVRAAAVFRGGHISRSLVAQQPKAKAAVPAQGVGMNALDGRWGKNALGCAQAALNTARRVDLPDIASPGPSRARGGKRAISKFGAAVAEAVAVACSALLLQAQAIRAGAQKRQHHPA